MLTVWEAPPFVLLSAVEGSIPTSDRLTRCLQPLSAP